jgi:hypothetical protein
MKGYYALTAAAGLFLVWPAPSSAETTRGPRNLRAYCAAHKSYGGPGEDGTTNREVLAMGANTWRCMDGKVLVCNLGASGAACESTMPYDADRRKVFVEFCHQNPNSDYIAASISRGLAGEWRCRGVVPVESRRIPVDKRGYFQSSWRPLR